MDKKRLINEKRVIDIFGMRYLDYRDKEVVRYVIKSLKGSGAKITTGKRVEFNSVLLKSLGNLGEVFGSEVGYATKAKISGLKVQPIVDVPHSFASNITYSYDPDIKVVDEKTGTINHLISPNVFYEEDRVFLGHEFIHMNKDLNFDEYKLSMVCSDVIPMLFEFIMMGDCSKEVLNSRLALLDIETETYLMADKKIKSSGKEKDLYRVVQSRSGQYLNSFYYATVLYKMYLNDPRIILDYMRRIIKCEMTTLDMLKDLGIYLVNNNEMYDEQIEEFKSIIRK